MPEITTADDARWVASWNYTKPSDLEPITGDSDEPIGWTFATCHANSRVYGWVLTDGRISPATEWTRDAAETYARNNLADSKRPR